MAGHQLGWNADTTSVAMHTVAVLALDKVIPFGLSHRSTCSPATDGRAAYRVRICVATTTAEGGKTAVVRGLTPLAAGVTKCADNDSGQSRKRLNEVAQGQVHKGTQEVQEQSRWRWSPRHLGVHRNQDSFIPRRGLSRWLGPFPVLRSALTEAALPLPG